MTQTYPFAVSNDEFKSKRVLVTGGTKGMGEAVVRRFLLSGAEVATTARSPLPQGQNPSLFVQTDVGTADGVKRVVDHIQQEWHGLDILVNCLGGSPSLARAASRRLASVVPAAVQTSSACLPGAGPYARGRCLSSVRVVAVGPA